MSGKRFAEGPGEVILQGLHFAVRSNVFEVWLGGFTGVQFHKAIGDFLDAYVLALIIA